MVADGEVKIVDEFTGRILDGRRWSDGLHQAVEAKEGVRIKEENQTLATVTLQNYFKLYEKLSGMTGTANTEAGEFADTYGLEVVQVPTNRAMIRMDEPDLIYKTEAAKFEALADDIQERFDKGQPVLVGTISVEKSEHLSNLLDKRGIPHSVLNAKKHEQEAVVVTQAGRLHGVTVATNMAGRGVDILLGGNPEGLATEEMLANDSSPEQDPDKFGALVEQFKSQCTEEGDRIRELGGLYVLGTERHESRRIDDQLRGRAGRQGDPGESRFYLSLEDELMRLFATGAMNWVMGKAFPDDLPLEARMVTKAIERAQRTVEDRNFEIRKDVLKYDEVMNEQRKIIYKRRQQIIEGGDLREESVAAIEGAIDHVVTAATGGEEFAEDWDVDELMRLAGDVFPVRVTREQVAELPGPEEVFELLNGDALDQYDTKEDQIGAEQLREIERRVMLSVIDQHWREHLFEMDYLREGINLRAMGQQDPLAEWQREGFDMFEAMMESIKDDFVRYIFRLEVVADDAPAPTGPQPALLRAGGPGGGQQQLLRRGGLGPDGGARRGDAGGGGGGPTAAAGGEGEAAGPQRALLLRERQEVQAVPRALSPRSGRSPSRRARVLRAEERAGCVTSPTTSRPSTSGSTRPAPICTSTRSGPGSPSSRPMPPARTSGTTRTRRARSRASCRASATTST